MNNIPVENSVAETDNTPIRVGIFRREFPDQLTTLKAMSYMAKHFNVELFFFAIKDINFEDNTVNAVRIDGDNRTREIIPIPKIIDNHPHVFWNENGDKVQRLIRDHYFIRRANRLHSGKLVTKQTMHDILLKDGRFKDYLIETHPVSSFKEFFALLTKYNQDVVMKPLNGSEGEGVTRILFKNDKYVAHLKKKKFVLQTEDDLAKFYDEHFTDRRQILQPYIISRTRQGAPFDIRLHLRRGAEGKFNLFPYPRIGSQRGIVSNISAGGHTMPIKTFLQIEFGNRWRKIHHELTEFAMDFIEFYQSLFRNILYNVGIDVAILRRGKDYEFKIFEINMSYLGSTAIPIQAAITSFEYYCYIDRQLKEGKLNLP